MQSTVDDMDNPAPTSEQPDGGTARDQPAPDQPTSHLTGSHPTGPGPRVTGDQVKDLGRLRRTIHDRHLAGVAGGLARHLDIDPIIVRVAFVVLTFFGGAGLLLYAACWLLVPEEGSSSQPLGLDERSRKVGLVGAAVLALLCALGDWTGAFWFPWPFAIVAALIVWFLHRKSSSSSSGQAAPYGSGGPYGPESPYATEAPYAPGLEATHQAWDPAAYARPTQPRNPRKRGPILFWFTLALIALAEGIMGVVDLSGVDIVPSAYPALALGVTTVMLALGAFWGRAGGLILVGLVAAAATGITTAAHTWDSETVTYRPMDTAAVHSSYDIPAGELVVDLSGIEDVEGLDGRELRIDNGAGRVEVIVPDGVDVAVRASAGAGDIRVFDRHTDGLDLQQEGFRDGGDEVPDMSIDIDLGVGEVVVREQ